MAENSSRRAIEFLVYGALPPHSTNVLWMDSSDPTLPVLKIWWNGAWVPVHTDKSKEIAELAKAVERLTGTNASQQSTIVTLTDVTAKEATLTSGIDTIIAAIRNIDLSGVAKQGSNPAATLTDTQSYASSAATDAASAKNLIGTPASGQASDLFGAIRGITIDTTILAKETQVKDGNDTAISVSKEVRSEIGTGSDTAAETGTLFAVVKWVKDKVVSIYNAITDSTNGLSAIKSAIPTVVSIQNGLATETNATSNKNAILQAIADNAGIPTMTIPDSTASQELAPNVLYIFSTRSSALTLTLGTPIVGIANEYHFFLVTDTTAPTITWPTGISWNGGNAPTIAGDKTYEVSILNNIAVYLEL